MRPRRTVLIEVPEGIEVLVERDARGVWPRAARLAQVVRDAYAHPTLGARLEELSRDLAVRPVLPARRHGRVISMHLTARLASQLRALDAVQRQLTRRWEHRGLTWEEREDQEQVLLGVRPMGELWKQVGRKKVKIRPKRRRSLPVSVRFPPELYEEVTAYAEHLGSDRTYVIVECVRQALGADRAWQREWKKRAQL